MRKSKPPKLSKKEQERLEYETWKRMHEQAHVSAMMKIGHKTETAADFFAKQAKANAALRRGPQSSNAPKPEPVPQAARGGVDTSDMSIEELEDLRRREEAAQAETREKMARTGPVYNKGGSVYLTDELLKDVQAGNTRRRN